MKINIEIDSILKKQGKSRYWLVKETGIYYPNIKGLCENTTTAIKFESLEKICKALDCEPGDILKLI